MGNCLEKDDDFKIRSTNSSFFQLPPIQYTEGNLNLEASRKTLI